MIIIVIKGITPNSQTVGNGCRKSWDQFEERCWDMTSIPLPFQTAGMARFKGFQWGPWVSHGFLCLQQNKRNKQNLKVGLLGNLEISKRRAKWASLGLWGSFLEGLWGSGPLHRSLEAIGLVLLGVLVMVYCFSIDPKQPIQETKKLFLFISGPFQAWSCQW